MIQMKKENYLGIFSFFLLLSMNIKKNHRITGLASVALSGYDIKISKSVNNTK